MPVRILMALAFWTLVIAGTNALAARPQAVAKSRATADERSSRARPSNTAFCAGGWATRPTLTASMQ